MASDVKWIKITTDIFDDEKILLIESLPDAYAIITVWFKLLCMAGKQNNSGVFLMGKIAYTDKMLATIFRMKESTVTMALNTFEQFGMIEIVNGVITIPNWEKHQTLDKFELAKEQTRKRVAKHREKQKQLSQGNATCNATCNATVTQSNADRKEEEKEEEKEKDKDKELSVSHSSKAANDGRADRVIDNSVILDIKNQIEFNFLTSSIDADDLELAVSIIAEMYAAALPQQFNGMTYSAPFVQRRSMQFRREHVELAFEKFYAQREKIQNTRRYLAALLFNAVDEIGCHYSNAIRVDGAVV